MKKILLFATVLIFSNSAFGAPAAPQLGRESSIRFMLDGLNLSPDTAQGMRQPTLASA